MATETGTKRRWETRREAGREAGSGVGEEANRVAQGSRRWRQRLCDDRSGAASALISTNSAEMRRVSGKKGFHD